MALLRAYGAEVVLCPTAVAPDHPDSYYSVTARLAEEIPGAYHPDQYHNPENPAAHELTTGPEIWRQTAGRVTHFVAGIGTGGTISGIGRYLKSQNPEVQIVGRRPGGLGLLRRLGQALSRRGHRRGLLADDLRPEGGRPGRHGERHRLVPHRPASRRRRGHPRRRLDRAPPSGRRCSSARSCSRDDVVVVLIPDSGRGYLSKLYNDEWMADHGFLRTSGHTVADLLERKGAHADRA